MPVRQPDRPARRATLAAAAATLALAAGTPVAQAATSTTLAGTRAVTAVTTTPVVDNSTRAGALDAYENVFVAVRDTPIGWTGAVAGCTPGAPSAASQNATLTAVNYFRSMVGVAPVTFDPTWSSQAQQAALMMEARGTIDHVTYPSWACYTAGGASAAQGGNLGFGYRSGPRAIAGYVDDSRTASLGHRRQTLDARFTAMGHGQTTRADSLKMFESYPTQPVPAGTPAFVSWPDSGYFPSTLLPGGGSGPWSVQATASDVDLAAATVTVTDVATGAAVPVTVNHPDPAYGMGSDLVAFTPAAGYPGGHDKAYRVTVRGIVKAGVAQAPYTYTTTLFDPAYAPPQSISWSLPTTVGQGQSLPLTATASSNLPVSYTSSNPWACTISGGTVTFAHPGRCTLTATQAGDSTHAAASTTRTVTVTVAPKPVKRRLDRVWGLRAGLLS